MKKVYLIGDTHGQANHLSDIFATYNVKNDVVIVLGDFGFIWNQDWQTKVAPLQEVFAAHDSVLAFVDGNHENFEIINSLPVGSWNGGSIHQVMPNIIHLMRGQIFSIFGNTYFTMGGANSIDKVYRRDRITWWKEEDITYADMELAIQNLGAVQNKVDYILTHTCAMSEKRNIGIKDFFDSHNENQLQHIRDTVKFKHWYFGHYHTDWNQAMFTCLWEKFVRIEENDNVL